MDKWVIMIQSIYDPACPFVTPGHKIHLDAYCSRQFKSKVRSMDGTGLPTTIKMRKP